MRRRAARGRHESGADALVARRRLSTPASLLAVRGWLEEVVKPAAAGAQSTPEKQPQGTQLELGGTIESR